MYRVYGIYSDSGKEKENGSYESENRVWGLALTAQGSGSTYGVPCQAVPEA